MCSRSPPAPLHHANTQKSVHQSPTHTHRRWETLSENFSNRDKECHNRLHFAKNYFALTFRSSYHKKRVRQKSSISRTTRKGKLKTPTHRQRERDSRKEGKRGLTELQPLLHSQRHGECRQPDAVCLASPQSGGCVQQPRLLAAAAAAEQRRRPRHRLP